MADPTFTPTEPPPSGAGQLLAVFRDEATAERVVVDLRDRGIAAHVAGRDEVVASLQAEMKEETEASLIGPGLPLHNKEMTRTSVPITIGASLVGGLLFGCLAWVIDIQDVGFWQKFGLLFGVGVFAVGTFAYLAAGLVGARAANRPPAAQRGVTLAVDDASQGTADVLAAHDPIRIDRRDADGAVHAIVTEDDLHPGLETRRTADQLRGSDRQDEY
jgi:hypothetical protein